MTITVPWNASWTADLDPPSAPDLAADNIRPTAERDALAAEVARLREALNKAANRIEWCGGLIHQDKARDKASEWAEEARAAAQKEGE